jgi:hypothetical protein
MRPAPTALIATTVLTLATAALGQTAPSSTQPPTAPMPALRQNTQAPAQLDLSQADLQQIVAREFGPAFSTLDGFRALQADLDGDGNEDLIIVATSDDPMLDEAQYHYKVSDPYNTFFGFGDPHVTSRFQVDTGARRMLLIVNDWQAPERDLKSVPKSQRPGWKAKFVLINVPFQKLDIGRALINRKVIAAIKAQETDGQSFVYWSGKRYNWDPGNQ